MNKNERLNIKPLQNGYLVEYEYRKSDPNKDMPYNWNYISEESMFATWDEVVAFIKSKPLEVPPPNIV